MSPRRGRAVSALPRLNLVLWHLRRVIEPPTAAPPVADTRPVRLSSPRRPCLTLGAGPSEPSDAFP